jgi:hypothetical protein
VLAIVGIARLARGTQQRLARHRLHGGADRQPVLADVVGVQRPQRRQRATRRVGVHRRVVAGARDDRIEIERLGRLRHAVQHVEVAAAVDGHAQAGRQVAEHRVLVERGRGQDDARHAAGHQAA